MLEVMLLNAREYHVRDRRRMLLLIMKDMESMQGRIYLEH
jgi:hypothetical protein